MCFVNQQINIHIQELDADAKRDLEQDQISQYYFSQLTDNKDFASKFVEALFTGDYLGDEVALKAESLIKTLIQEITNPDSEASASLRFKDGIQSLCDEAAKQVIQSGQDVFGLIEKCSGYPNEFDEDVFF